MLVYHPALDPYHSASRMIKVLQYPVQRALEIERVRIIDFFLVFPAWIKKIRVPREYAAMKNKVIPDDNPYFYGGRPADVFYQMQPLQMQAISLLAARDLLDKAALSKNEWRRGSTSLPKDLLVLARPATDEEKLRLEFLIMTLLKFPLVGADGLKHRTGLLEFRYDPT